MSVVKGCIGCVTYLYMYCIITHYESSSFTVEIRSQDRQVGKGGSVIILGDIENNPVDGVGWPKNVIGIFVIIL